MLDAIFDPFKDYKTEGYLRNTVKEKNLDIVKRLEHDLFTAKLPTAMDYLAARKTFIYSDFLEVHRILFGGLYPWAGSDRSRTAPHTLIRKGETYFCHPQDARKAVEEGLRIAQIKERMRKSPGQVMGFFAYGHPFLDGNGRTMLVVHSALCNRAGFSIDWGRTDKSAYLNALSEEIEKPNDGILDKYLASFIEGPLDSKLWGTAVRSIKGLDGMAAMDTVEGDVNDPAAAKKYEEFERRRGYQIAPGP